MGQKVNPTGYRIGVMEDWRSRWYATKLEFKDLIGEDFKIRKFVKQFYGNIHHRDKFKGKKEDAPVNAGIPKVEIERTRDAVKVIIFTARPGIIIGRKGTEVEKLQERLQTLTGRRIEIKIEEVTRPEINAQLISEEIAEQLQKRGSFRRTIKRGLETTMGAGAKGVKILLSGRLGGAEMSRSEQGAQGSIPLSTLRAKIDYGFAEAKTPQGHIGVKVWVNQGDYLEKDDSNANDAQAGQVSKNPKRPRKR
ncbi:MAG: 30S ribosomal protein S3 [Isosphaeraceae bacterium]